MELTTTGRMRRNEQLDRIISQKATPQSPTPKTQSPKARTPDRCTLSRQALAYLERQNQLAQELEEKRAREQSKINSSLSDMESKKKQLDLLGKAMDTMRKCMKIAAAIIKGNKVPAEDLKYLMENDPEGYKMALALRRDNPDPEKEKSVLDDEDRNAPRTESTGASNSAPPSPEPAASSGSETADTPD